MTEPLSLAIDRRAPTVRTPLGNGTSWVDLVPGFLREPAALLADLVQSIDWQQGEVWRFDRYVEEQRLGAMVRQDSHPAIRQTGLHLEATYRVPFSGATAVLYRSGSDFQGLHSDRQMKWLDDTLVAIVVLGEARPFRLRPRRDVNHPVARADATADVVVTPGHGDLLVMGGRSQRDWLHGVPAHVTDQPRLSLTWRWAGRSGRPDTGPGYFDGRHFSDRPGATPYRMRRPGS